MVKKPIVKIKKPKSKWLSNELLPVQCKKPFLIITIMIYLCNYVAPDNQIKSKLLTLFKNKPDLPIYKLGFLNNWQNHPIWK
jgi:abortive infection bacteriophage resistance protein